MITNKIDSETTMCKNSSSNHNTSTSVDEFLKIKERGIVNYIQKLHEQKELLKQQLNLGIINMDDARDETIMITKKERKLKEQFVLEKHAKGNGEPRSISYHKPTTSVSKEYYATWLPNGKKIKSTTYDVLIDKLFVFYTDGISDFSVASIFEAALNEKEVTENPQPHTLIKNRIDFNRYISEEWQKKDIRQITDLDIKKYTQEFVNREHPKQKAYFSYKGILNLIFRYATIHKLILCNPMDIIQNKPYIKSCDTRKARPEEKILSPAEIARLTAEVRRRMTFQKWGPYYINGYAMLFAIETGVRVGELCAIKWNDIKERSIHIHAQQLTKTEDGKKVYYYNPTTKNEKGISQDGREFPLTQKIKLLLNELKDLQDKLDIHSEYIFCHEDGDWIKTDAYITFLRRLCRSLGFHVTNNHALRMSLNSNVLIPLGISPTNRAAMLGHSVETNLKYYSYAEKEYLDQVCNLLDGVTAGNIPNPDISENGNNASKNAGSDTYTFEGTSGDQSNVVIFSKRRSLKTLNLQRFQALL